MGLSGFLAELQRQAKRAAREQEKANKASQRAYAAAVRAAEVAKKKETQDRIQAQKASAVEQKRLEKEAKMSHEAAMAAEVECLNLNLEGIEEDLIGILAATLSVDDFVDLETLRVTAKHPPFGRPDLVNSSKPPLPVIDPPMPLQGNPPAPMGIFSFLGKKAYEKAKLAARLKYEADMSDWQLRLSENQARREAEAAGYQEKEKARLEMLQIERERYSLECQQREDASARQNEAVDSLIANLGYGTSDAIEEYIGIVLSNAVYPDHFPIDCSFSFDPNVAEIKLRVTIPPPHQISTIKSYKYTKSVDEIVAVAMSSKACKDRYSSAIDQISLRVPHEIFEADRRGLIATISLELGTQTSDPATGLTCFIPFVAMGVEREKFSKLDLANVIPSATLSHLGASVSRNPYGLVPANISGVRRS